MKFVIIGLGIFGSSLAEKLTRLGHEVIGIDNRMKNIEILKEKITHTVCLDSTDPKAVASLPISETDCVIIGIGEDEGASIMTTALMKQLQAKRIISRAVSPLHETVLEAMGVDEIVHPEEETAERWAKKLNLQGVIDSFELTDDYNIVEATLPKKYVGKTLEETGIRRKFNILVLTTIRTTGEKNILGMPRKVKKIQEVASAKTMIQDGDILVLYGKAKDIERLLNE